MLSAPGILEKEATVMMLVIVVVKIEPP